MILAAQWVRSQALDCSGVNAYLYRSPGSPVPLWIHDDERALGQQVEEQFRHPGQFIGSRFDVPPGGNDVLAFLDVIANEDVTLDQLERLLAARPRGSELKPCVTQVWVRDEAVARYQAGLKMAAVIRTVFAQLADVMLALFKSGRGEGPLRILVEQSEGGSTYSMDHDSRSRLERIHGVGWPGPRVRVGMIEAQDFRTVHGEDVRDHLIEVLTGLSRTHVENLGGAEFFDVATRQVLRQWPSGDLPKGEA
jgi:hypothetical protein